MNLHTERGAEKCFPQSLSIYSRGAWADIWSLTQSGNREMWIYGSKLLYLPPAEFMLFDETGLEESTSEPQHSLLLITHNPTYKRE